MKVVHAPFKNWDLVGYLNDRGEGMVAIKPICEAIGVDWKSQFRKITSDPKFSCGDMTTTGSDGKKYEMTCLPVHQIYGWLYSINSRKVKPEIAPVLLEFQQHVHMVLNAHFSSSVPREEFQRLVQMVDTLSEKIRVIDLEKEELRDMVKVDRLVMASDAGRALARARSFVH